MRRPATPCLASAALQPQMLAAWRRPSRGAPTGPRCPGRMCSGRPYEAADTCCGRARAQRPSGEYGLRGVARAFFLCVERREGEFFHSHPRLRVLCICTHEVPPGHTHKHKVVHTPDVCVCVYIYIYSIICREREVRESERE